MADSELEKLTRDLRALALESGGEHARAEVARQDLKGRIADRNMEIVNLQHMVLERDTEISGLKAQVAALEAENGQLKNELAGVRAQPAAGGEHGGDGDE